MLALWISLNKPWLSIWNLELKFCNEQCMSCKNDENYYVLRFLCSERENKYVTNFGWNEAGTVFNFRETL